jgi:glycerate kinase
MRFLVAPDSFKGTFDASEVAEAIASGLEEGGAEAERCPVADGGEGTMEVVLGALGGERRSASVHDPLRRPIEASFGLLGDGATAIVETAQASGLPLVAAEERDAERADTFGTGELIAAAVAAGARRVLLAVGGSASTDGGAGAIEALRQAGLLGRIEIEVLCDVSAPYEEAARLFAPQKGADAATVERLTARLETLAAGLPRDSRGVPMSGCAGGLSGGLWAYGAHLRPGAAFVLERSDSTSASRGPTPSSPARAASTLRAWRERSSARSPNAAPPAASPCTWSWAVSPKRWSHPLRPPPSRWLNLWRRCGRRVAT